MQATKAPTLAELLRARREAWAAMDVHRPLGDLDPERRASQDEASAAFREADRAIVERLRKIGRPARAGKDELRLTADRDGFAVVEPGTGRLVHCDNAKYTYSGKILHRYTEAGA